MTDERLAQIRARAATKDPDAWPDDVSLFVNAGPDEGWSRYDLWHTGGPGGPWLEAATEEAARSIVHAVDELHTLRAERNELLAEVDRLRTVEIYAEHLRASMDAVRAALGNGADEAVWPPGLTVAEAVERLRGKSP